ncbi:hypothetical protein [Methanosarcina lacustris]|nr:hypothetical protein [Methanosarcina lacustris]
MANVGLENGKLVLWVCTGKNMKTARKKSCKKAVRMEKVATMRG